MTLDLMSNSPINVYKYMLGNWRENQELIRTHLGLYSRPQVSSM